MSGRLNDVALNALSRTDIRALHMKEKDEGFRMLRNFLKGVFVLVDMHTDRFPAPNSRKKKIIDILCHSALQNYTFIKGNERTTVKASL